MVTKLSQNEWWVIKRVHLGLFYNIGTYKVFGRIYKKNDYEYVYKVLLIYFHKLFMLNFKKLVCT